MKHRRHAWWLQIATIIFLEALAKCARVGGLRSLRVSSLPTVGTPNVELEHRDVVEGEEGQGCQMSLPSLADARQEEHDGPVFLIHWMPGTCANTHAPLPADGPTHPHVRPKGTFLLLHAAGHQARHFYQLPEESQMTLAVLNRGYVALAVETYPEYGGSAWDMLHDGPLVRDSLKSYLAKYNLQDLPVYGIGVSNGGNFLHYLFKGLDVNFAGLHFNVSPGGALSGKDTGGWFAEKAHPPVAFTCMLHDGYTPKIPIRDAVSHLKSKGTPVQLLQAPPQPIGSLVLWAERMRISPVVAGKMVKLMYDGGYTAETYWGNTGQNSSSDLSRFKNLPLYYWRYLELNTAPKVMQYLTHDPEVGAMASSNFHAVAEEVNVIEGQHSPTAQHIRKTLDFLLWNSNWKANLKINKSTPAFSHDSPKQNHSRASIKNMSYVTHTLIYNRSQTRTPIFESNQSLLSLKSRPAMQTPPKTKLEIRWNEVTYQFPIAH